MVYPDLTGHENLALTARLYGLKEPQAALAQIGARFELAGFMQRPARTYSRGQLQRLALARALLPAPRLLLLDEPSTGLDAAGTARLVDVMRQERARGAIVVLVTHDAALAESVADRRLALKGGKNPGERGVKRLLEATLALCAKELRVELRTGEIVVTTALFATLIAVLTLLAFYVDRKTALQVAPGVLWIAVTFAGVLAMGRSFQREREHEVYRALLLSPVPRSAIYLSKVITSFLFLMIVETLVVLEVTVLFNLDLGRVVVPLAGLLLLGTLGFTPRATCSPRSRYAPARAR